MSPVDPNGLAESAVEIACLEYLSSLGYETRYGPDVAPDGEAPERDDFRETVLVRRLATAVRRLNPHLPTDAVDSAVATILRPESQNLLSENWRLHEAITSGVPVSYRGHEGRIVYDRARIVDFDDIANNDLLAINQFTVVEGIRKRRADIVVFVNGLPIALFELKGPAGERAALHHAFQQVQTYKEEVSSLLVPNEVVVLSDGVHALFGTVASSFEQFGPWRTIDGPTPAPSFMPQLEVLIRGLFDRARLLDVLRHFVVFSDERSGLAKRIAKYHQYWAVNRAIDEVIRASSPDGDRRAGVVWHTQGSGKSLEMLFFARRMLTHPRLRNPTVLVVTDRIDLDDQLFDEVFSIARDLPERPVQAQGRDDLQSLLSRASGGLIFSTLQKFLSSVRGEEYPMLSDRANVIVLVDEAHRSQYDFVDGFAKNLRSALPAATFVAFTGTPIDVDDRSTRQVFGEYIDVYDLARAVEDGATVPLYYEARLVSVHLAEEHRRALDDIFESVTEGAEPEERQRLASHWARLDVLLGAGSRLASVADDLLTHWEARRDAVSGKAMVACASRSIAVRLYDEIVSRRPAWASDSDATGRVKVVITGSAEDGPALQPHVRTKARLRELKSRVKNPDDELEMIIVCDMWLTGFDAPPLHTLYLDKPLRGHTLMQAIARVNRTFRDKPSGLIVDYLGVAQELRQALAEYSAQDRSAVGVPISAAIGELHDVDEVMTELLHPVDWTAALSCPPQERLGWLARALDFLTGDDELAERFLTEALRFGQAFGKAVPHPDALRLSAKVEFVLACRSQLLMLRSGGQGGDGDGSQIESVLRQAMANAFAPDGVVDIFTVAGLPKPELSLLTDEFVAAALASPQRNLQIELIRRLVVDQLAEVGRTNIVEFRRFSESLQRVINAYQNRALDSAQIITELIDLARALQEAAGRGDRLGLSEAEVAFYDAVRQNDAAILELGDDVLRDIARELVDAVRRNATIDWALKESVRAKLRSTVRRLLLRRNYPPDRAESATQLVLEQAELMAATWTTAS